MRHLRIAETRRARGMGTITRYGEGWRAKLRWQLPDGMTVNRTRVCRIKPEAESALAEFRRERDLGIKPSRKVWTVGEWLGAWIQSRGDEIAGTTLRQYEDSGRLVMERIGTVKLSELNVRQIDELMTRLEKDDYAPNSRRLARVVLGGAVREALRQGLLVNDPTLLAKPIRHERPEIGSFSADEISQFVEAARDDELGTLWLLVASVGLRRGEALALRWNDVDFVKGSISISKQRTTLRGQPIEGPTKTARSVRVIPLPEFVMDSLTSHKAKQLAGSERLLSYGIRPAGGYAFTSPMGEPWHPDTISKKFAAFAQRAGLGSRHLHELRHLSATLMLQAGVPVAEVAAILGHASTRMVDQTYGHLRAELLREAVEKGASTLNR